MSHDPAADLSAARIERPEDAPPILGSWRRIYVLVMAVFAALVLLFAWLTQVFQ